MEIEIVETPVGFSLYGQASAVDGRPYAEVGLRLMNQVWKIVEQSRTSTAGVNHWVYLPADRMFVGVELLEPAAAPEQLEPLKLELPRYLKHLHIGPYQALPEKWKALEAELASPGETMSLPSLEVYGHHCGDTAKLETTILIGLEPKKA